MAAEAFKQSPCELCCYGVLDDVSIAYPPATGMLLTRYAPFRRSPPEYCYPALPLDLHVLSLPLAFILSQDQTLLCIYTYYSSLTPTLPIPFRIDALVSCTFSVLACTFLPDFSMNFVKNPARCPNGNAKVELNFDSTKLFSKKNKKIGPQNEGQNLYLF